MMTLDLSGCTIDGVSLGTSASKISVNLDSGVTIRCIDGIASGFHIRLSERYSQGAVFPGRIVLGDGSVIQKPTDMKPEDIIPHFGHYDAHWNDGVEVNYQYIVNGVRIEFSWSLSEDGRLYANYIDVEYA